MFYLMFLFYNARTYELLSKVRPSSDVLELAEELVVEFS